MTDTPARQTTRGRLAVVGVALLAASSWLAGAAVAETTYVWVEGEKPTRSTVHRHSWYDSVKRDMLSGSDLISNYDERQPGQATYRVDVPKDGDYEFWVRVNPFQAKLSYKLNNGEWLPIDAEKERQGDVNVAADGKLDHRFLAWSHVGRVTLRKGANTIQFGIDGKLSHSSYLDCFVFASGPFKPNGVLKPGQAAPVARAEAGWFAFTPPADPYSPASGIDLRSLNEKQAGDGGFITVKGGRFVHEKTGQAVRFWAVNGPSGDDRESFRRDARTLAKRGVNLARIHTGYFDAKGDPETSKVLKAMEKVEALKAEGIYTEFSVYFPLWFRPPAGLPGFQGYAGDKNTFASLYFNKDFQKKYRSWWEALLLTPAPKTGKRLVDDPAVAALEIVNEDSYFFWTFNPENIPDPQLKIVEAQFGAWLKARYGSIDAAMKRWNGVRSDRDRPSEGRIGFRPLYNMSAERTERDKDAARFLTESQRTFYADTYRFLRGLGFKGTITASNWVTANAEILGPLEKYSYTAGDFIDRHGYFGCHAEGPDSAWAIKEGLVYVDRSALKFEAEEPGKPKQFVHPSMDTKYDGKPSMISETAWNRPNRYRTEAPLYFAAYGALQGTDAIVHFAFDGPAWSVKPQFFMQPWTMMTPGTMGQFPAAALIYRKALIAEGDLLADLSLSLQDLYDLKGTPLPLDASFDELRMKDVPKGSEVRPGNVIDPLIHYAGRTAVTFSDKGGPSVLKDLHPYIDRAKQTVTSTNGHLKLDYGKGVLILNAPAVQGISGALVDAGPTALADLSITSTMPLGHVVAVSLDDLPLATSRKILLQVMSEEKPTDFRTEPATSSAKKIVGIGRDPWLVRDFEGVVRFKRPDASKLKVTALDPNGDPGKSVLGADAIRLGKSVLYYLIEPSGAAN